MWVANTVKGWSVKKGMLVAENGTRLAGGLTLREAKDGDGWQPLEGEG